MNGTAGKTWWSELRAIAARMAWRGASDAADDLVQEVALAALENGAGVERAGAWTERVARNAAIDRWRVERRRGELAAQLDAPCAPSRDPEAALLARERRRAVRRELLALPRAQRRAALLRFHGGMSFDGVAARLGTEPPTARTRVHRALVALRARMQGLRALWLPAWHGAQVTVLGLAIVGSGVTAVPSPRLRSPAAHASEPARAARAGSLAQATPLPLPLPSPSPSPSPSPTASPAGARRVAPGSRPAASQAAPLPPAQVFVFDPDAIDVEVRGPEDEIVVIERPTPQPSLIELRRHFIAEIMKSLEEL